MSVVTVLTPNGRRQNVKITPNTTLLQVLEEVCMKHGFKPEEYDIRHHNKIMDISAIFRFSGLPNNAQLEMTEATKQRQESPVVLGLQLESGDRLTGEFTPTENLWNVIMKLKPEAKTLKSPVIIYMRKEVHGRENLEKTTLRSLGLTGGRAALRFFNKTPEELRTQANVSALLTRPPAPKPEEEDPKPSESTPVKEAPVKAPVKQSVEETADARTREKEKKTPEKTPEVKEEKPSKKGSSTSEKPKTAQQTRANLPQRSPEKENERNSEAEQKVILLGERNAVAYNLNKVKPLPLEEIPDDFYDLTVSDAKLLLGEAKQLCRDLEDAPLMTSAQREFERNKRILSLLHQYKKTVLRIKFPDRTVLQGTFSSVEKISDVEKFVSDYLENPNISFYLYTTPPKEILKSESNLLESNCVPCAVLYFGVTSGDSSQQFLRSDVFEKFSSPSAAALTAFQSRGLISRNITDIAEEKEEKIIKNVDTVSVAGPSRLSRASSPTLEAKQSREQESSPPFKVPKWFKMQK